MTSNNGLDEFGALGCLVLKARPTETLGGNGNQV